MFFKKYHLSISILTIAILTTFSCYHNPEPFQTGFIVLSVMDNDLDQTPLSGVEITVTPEDYVCLTNEDGICTFEINPGDYYVDGHVCCVGPSDIYYHIPVTVVENDTIYVEMWACTMCL